MWYENKWSHAQLHINRNEESKILITIGMKARVAGSVRHENKWKHTQLHLKRNEESKNLNMCICYHDSSFLVLDPNCKSLQTNIQRSYITYVEAKRERKLLYSSSEHHLTMHVFSKKWKV